MEFLSPVTETYYVVLLFVGLISGLVGAMGGSGGMIITPFMVLTGVPPVLAIGSMKVASIGMWSAVLLKFKNANKIRWEYVPVLAILSGVGAFIGASWAVEIDQSLFSMIIGATFVLVTILSMKGRKAGLIEVNVSATKRNIGYLIYFLLMILGGVLGAVGVFVIFTLIHFLGLKALEAHATDLPPWYLLTIISSAIFMWEGKVDYTYAGILFVSMTLGGYLGAKIAIKGGDKLVKSMVLAFAFFAGIKMIYDGLEYIG